MKDDSNLNITDEQLIKSCLDNLDIDELFNLSKQVSEKFLDKDNDLYQYFHDNKNIGKED